MRLGLAAFAAAMLISGSAYAADIVAPEETAFDWTGFYIGATAGYGWGDTQFFDENGESEEHSLDGFVGGATAGYNLQLDSFLLGLEADVSYSDIDARFDSHPGWGCADECQADVQWFGTARLRAGLPLDHVLPYITGGLAFADVHAENHPDPSYDGTDTVWGWTLGGGIEWAIDESWSVKAEYLWVDLEKADLGGPFDFKASADFSVVRGGINYRF